MRIRLALLMGLLLFVGPANAAGPTSLAQGKAGLWPHAIESRTAFDAASRAELLVSATVLDTLIQHNPNADALGIRRLHEASVEQWLEATRRQWLDGFRQASTSCSSQDRSCGFSGASWDELVAFGQSYAETAATHPDYAAWLTHSQAFYTAYFREQWRLAALFPSPSSEILRFDDGEWLGDELDDGQFLLSFDDGPTTAGGHTDRYIALLNEHKVPALFFVLGESLQRRKQATSPAALASLYEHHCLASHGMAHNAHPRWTDWQASIDDTRRLILQLFPEQETVAFRPPYGQRNAAIASHVHATADPLVLWNIDSQDWNRRIGSESMLERIKKLMLVRRQGIILFHDTQAKALSVLPDLIEFAYAAELEWRDCDRF
ncbi:hypothetical protein CAI21_01870 [Alkalilimnicola ehrlichii]|uniref:NodB homology domain-containing protein n=1 Tax=Alkalilimnicola ehrlichii TaxID=351052 RepID=A0A3E0X2S5_9GAMM|nr:polysaccharide deacetylase family protein [Alkalilimnicola ehrlichii]RFA31389.1 hypothetical protein CAI21_01870 [Alkalilimnicola ehrlichii]RFA39338.1 hypothetical protein CAL65_00530 [Alkalilimnicola ehrlichii]